MTLSSTNTIWSFTSRNVFKTPFSKKFTDTKYTRLHVNADPRRCVRKSRKSSALCCKWPCYKQLCASYCHLPLFQNTHAFWWYCLENLLNNWLDTAACQHQERLNRINSKTNKTNSRSFVNLSTMKIIKYNHHTTKTWRRSNLLSSKVLGCLLQMGFLLNEGRDRQTQRNETGALKTPKL